MARKFHSQLPQPTPIWFLMVCVFLLLKNLLLAQEQLRNISVLQKAFSYREKIFQQLEINRSGKLSVRFEETPFRVVFQNEGRRPIKILKPIIELGAPLKTSE